MADVSLLPSGENARLGADWMPNTWPDFAQFKLILEEIPLLKKRELKPKSNEKEC